MATAPSKGTCLPTPARTPRIVGQIVLTIAAASHHIRPMAYSRPRKRYVKRRSGGRRKRTYARPTRKRTYRSTRKRGSTRSMINRMAHKKKDVMLQASAAGTNPPPSSTIALGQNVTILGTSVDGTSIHKFMFCPTYRFLVPNNAAYAAYRTSSTPYIKGLSETFEFTPNDSSVWWHRRIVFSYKAPIAQNAAAMSTLGAQATADATSRRVFRDLSGETSGSYKDTVTFTEQVLFRGQQGTDWINPFTAPVDRSRVNLHSDKRLTLGSGNDSARPRIVKRYDAINKTLVYDDDENGLTIVPSPLSVQTKRGIGNIFVYDMIHCPVPEASTTQLRIGASQTLYWHEK